MSEQSRNTIRGKMSFTRNGMEVSDEEGNRLVVSVGQGRAYTIDPQGQRSEDFPITWDRNTALPDHAVSPEFNSFLRNHGLMRERPASFLSGLAGFAEALVGAVRPVGVNMRQGDIASLGRAMQEQARRDQQQAPVTVPENRAEQPGANVQQLADKFRQDAPATVKQVRADGGTKAPVAGTSHDATAYPVAAQQSATDLAGPGGAEAEPQRLGRWVRVTPMSEGMRALRAQMTPEERAKMDAATLAALNAPLPAHLYTNPPQPTPAQAEATQPDHGLRGVSAKRQDSPETFRA